MPSLPSATFLKRPSSESCLPEFFRDRSFCSGVLENKSSDVRRFSLTCTNVLVYCPVHGETEGNSEADRRGTGVAGHSLGTWLGDGARDIRSSEYKTRSGVYRRAEVAADYDRQGFGGAG